MVKQSYAGIDHEHAVFIGGFYDGIVADGAAGLHDVFNARTRRAIDVVAKGEKGVRAQRYALQSIEPRALLFGA